jgi:hypothetical protein
MDALVANIAHPPSAHRAPHADGDEHSPATWGSMGGFGNLDASGAVSGMTVPAVPDVSWAWLACWRWIAR